MQSTAPLSVMQSASVLLLCRLFLFFSSNTPYTAAYAAGTALAVCMQSILLLLLYRNRSADRIPVLLRFCAVLWALRLTAAFFTLYSSLHLTHPAAVTALLIPVLLYTVSVPNRAGARTAVLLLTAGCLGFLLLPVSGIRTAQFISLYTPDSVPAAFWREWLSSGDLLLFPMLVHRQNASAVRRTVLVRAAGCGIFLPALILFGAMQNTRLSQYSGSPFFLLLARTPLSDAVRTDGFWMLYAFCCGMFCISVCIRAGTAQMLPVPQPKEQC